ncbi:MAG: hypothetical protein WEG36_12385 [Gemmatimonadota bacterium]
MTNPTVQTSTVRSIDLPLGAGRQVVRITLAPDSLVIAAGWGIGEGFHRCGWDALPLVLPAGALPKLRAALEELSNGGEG